MLAVAVALGTLWLLTVIVENQSRSSALTDLTNVFFLVIVIEVLWALGYIVWPKKVPALSQRSTGHANVTCGQQPKA